MCLVPGRKLGPVARPNACVLDLKSERLFDVIQTKINSENGWPRGVSSECFVSVSDVILQSLQQFKSCGPLKSWPVIPQISDAHLRAPAR